MTPEQTTCNHEHVHKVRLNGAFVANRAVLEIVPKMVFAPDIEYKAVCDTCGFEVKVVETAIDDMPTKDTDAKEN